LFIFGVRIFYTGILGVKIFLIGIVDIIFFVIETGSTLLQWCFIR